MKFFPLMVSLLSACVSSSALAEGLPSNFTGNYSVDICPDGVSKPCGRASLTLLQNGLRICGDHTFVTPGAGRMNEGFAGSVRGTVVGDIAVLVITSGRNGGVVLIRTQLSGSNLKWETVEQVSEGSPPGDALIFGSGILRRENTASLSSELKAECWN
jgi:hypothetical protein